MVAPPRLHGHSAWAMVATMFKRPGGRAQYESEFIDIGERLAPYDAVPSGDRPEALVVPDGRPSVEDASPRHLAR